MSSHIKGVILAGSKSSENPASERRIDESQTEVQIMSPENTFTDISLSGNPAAEPKVTNTPTETLSPLIKPKYQSEAVLATTNAFQCGEDEVDTGNGPVLLGAQKSEVCGPLEKTESALEDACKVASAVEASSTVQEEMLRIEETAHQQTREEVTRLGDWCNHLEAENMELQTRLQDAEFENARTQRRLQSAEDERISHQTALGNAEGQIQDLMTSIEMHRSLMVGLQNHTVELTADISRYVQLGTDFYIRLQRVGETLDPSEEVFGEYQRLVSDAARYFPVPAEAGAENELVDDDDVVRVEEINDDDHDEGEDNNKENSGFHILDDDDVPRANRPMRPGTANRVPISVFATNHGTESTNQSSSPFGNFAQQAPAPATPASHTLFTFSENSIKPREKGETTAAKEPSPDVKASKSSARNRAGRGGIEPGQGNRRHGTHRARGTPCRGRDVSVGEAVGNTIDDGDASSAATAFPIDFGFSESSFDAGGVKEANAMPVFGH